MWVNMSQTEYTLKTLVRPLYPASKNQTIKTGTNDNQYLPISANTVNTSRTQQVLKTGVRTLYSDLKIKPSKRDQMTTESKSTENKDEGMPAWVMPILSALGSMGGSYMLWVKPLQDSFKAMSEQIEELREEIHELKQPRKTKQDVLDDTDDDDDYFLPSKKIRPVNMNSSKRNTISLR
jgi:hypothetical protein